MNDRHIFSEENFIKFIDQWDSLKEKYFQSINDESETYKLYRDILNTFYIDENNSVSNKQLYNVYKTVNLLYFEDEAQKYQHIIENVFNKFIYQTVNIEGIDILFNSKFFDIEWGMHFGYNFSKNEPTYYRDHYMHQVRNMYEMFVFLKEWGIEKYCTEWFEKSNKNVVSEFVSTSLRNDVKMMNENKRNVYKKILSLKTGDDFNIKETTDKEKEIEKLQSKFENLLFKQLVHEFIYSVTIVTSLLHDIGYPLAYLLGQHSAVLEMLPNSMQFIKSIDNVAFIDSKIRDSLLYKVVGINEIKEGIRDKDHGVLSAVILLLYYYDNGKIYHMDRTDRAVIEMSALIIYNHTIKYEIQEKCKEGRHYFQNIYSKNPLSYIFRICDDIQEWDRVYFENTKSSNYLICNDCYTPYILNEEGQKFNQIQKNIKIYKCACGKKHELFNLRQNEYRKTINVICCKRVEIAKKDKYKKIIFEYDLFDLLEICKYNLDYATYRAKEIKKIKKSLNNQNDLGNVYVDFFISNNPVEIKLEILRRFIKKNDIKTEEELLEKMEIIINKNDSKSKFDIINKQIMNRFNVYFKIIDTINSKLLKTEEDKKEFIKNLKINNRNFNGLLFGAMERYLDYLDCTEDKMDFSSGKLIEKYENLFQTEKKEVFFIKNYIHSYEYNKYLEDQEDDNWNFYLDLYYFYLLSSSLNEK